MRICLISYMVIRCRAYTLRLGIVAIYGSRMVIRVGILVGQ